MAKITERSEWRVVVHPKRRGDFGSVIFSDNHYTQEERERHFDNLTKDIRAAIKRHVDGVDRIDILYDTHDYCSHCGREWETEESGIPVCCSKAQDEWICNECGVVFDAGCIEYEDDDTESEGREAGEG